VGKNSLRCWRKLVLEEVEGIKGKGDMEETSDYSLNCTGKVTGPCGNNFDDKMSCGSVTETCEENNCDDEKLLEKNDQRMSTDSRGYSGDKVECESSSISFNSEDCESTVPRATRSRSKMNSESDSKRICVDFLDAHTSKSLPVLSCNNSTDNSQTPFFDRGRNAKALLPGLRRTVVSNTKDSNNEAETMETEVSSTVPSDHEELQNINSVHLVVCNDSVVTSSDEVLDSRMDGFKMELSEVAKEGTSIQNSVRQEGPLLKEHFENNNKNLSVNGVSQTCTENSIKALEPKYSYIRIKTPGFGDDIIQCVEDSAICEKLGQKSKKRPLAITCKTEEMVRENKEEFEEKTILDVPVSGDVAVSYVDDDTFHNEQEGDEEGFNEDVICIHGKLNCKLFIIITISLLKTEFCCMVVNTTTLYLGSIGFKFGPQGQFI
jgi:hypothetical protein